MVLISTAIGAARVAGSLIGIAFLLVIALAVYFLIDTARQSMWEDIFWGSLLLGFYAGIVIKWAWGDIRYDKKVMRELKEMEDRPW